MARKKKYTPKPFESKGGKDSFAMIFMSQVKSPAFMDLTDKQRLIYMYMKLQFYGQRNRPMKDYPDIADSEQYFYFNLQLAKEYGLVKSDGSRGLLYANIKAIEDHGFIKTISNGREVKQKSIYVFSMDWRFWKPEK